MPREKIFKPSDFLVRGLFLAVIVVGGLADRAQLSRSVDDPVAAPLASSMALAGKSGASAPGCRLPERDARHLLARFQDAARLKPVQARWLSCLDR